MKSRNYSNAVLFMKKKILVASVCAIASIASLPVVTTATAVVIVGVSNDAVAVMSDEARVRKMHYRKAERLRDRAKKARANGNNKKADRLEAKAKKIEDNAPVIDRGCGNVGQGDCP